MNEPNWTEVWQLNVSLATLVVTIVGLGFIWWQVSQSNRSQRVEVNNSVADSINELNQLLIADETLLKINGESKAEVLCHLKLNRFEQLFVLHQEHLLDEDAWSSTIKWVRLSMTRNEMKDAWPNCRDYYRPDFARWVDLIIETNERVVVCGAM